MRNGHPTLPTPLRCLLATVLHSLLSLLAVMLSLMPTQNHAARSPGERCAHPAKARHGRDKWHGDSLIVPRVLPHQEFAYISARAGPAGLPCVSLRTDAVSVVALDKVSRGLQPTRGGISEACGDLCHGRYLMEPRIWRLMSAPSIPDMEHHPAGATYTEP